MRKVIISCVIFVIFVSGTSCSLLDSLKSDLKGQLIGNSFTIKYYDNFGNNHLNVEGTKVGVENVIVTEPTVASNGTWGTTYTNSSVLKMTVDGNEMTQVGNSVVFEEDGLKVVDGFSLPENIKTDGSNGTINIIDSCINSFKNMIGKSKVVVVSSQLGIPICVYEGDEVYWEVPDDLPKMTKLNIDGKALYLHRVNYVILDKNML